VKNAVSHGVKEERNFLHIINRRKANWTGHMLRTNRLIKHVTEGNIEGKRRRERRRKQLLGNRGGGEGKVLEFEKEEALDRTFWRTHFGRGYRFVTMLRSAWMILILSRKTRKPKF
jgi:hypothetical protein